MIGQNQNLARQEVACEQKQQPIVDRHEVARQKALVLVPSAATVSVPKVGKKYHLRNNLMQVVFVEVFELFEDLEKVEGSTELVSVPYVWLRFLGREHYGEKKQLKYVTRNGVTGWRFVIQPAQVNGGCNCLTCDAVITFS